MRQSSNGLPSCRNPATGQTRISVGRQVCDKRVKTLNLGQAVTMKTVITVAVISSNVAFSKTMLELASNFFKKIAILCGRAKSVVFRKNGHRRHAYGFAISQAGLQICNQIVTRMSTYAVHTL